MNPIQMFYKVIVRRPLVTLFLLLMGLQSFSMAQTTTFQISGYCNTLLSEVTEVNTIVGYFDGIRSMTIDGNYAYLSYVFSGLEIVDITNPTNPVVLGGYDPVGYYYVQCAAAQGNYAYVCVGTAAGYSPAGSYGLQVLDVTDKTNPQVVNSIVLSGSPNEIKIVGNYAFVADDTAGLVILDISNPTNPVQVGNCVTSSNAYDVAIQGNYAYVADYYAGLRIIDISNLTNPVEVGYCDTQVGYLNTPGIANGVSVNSTYAFLADGQSGLRIINITNPTNPVEISHYDSVSYTYAVVAQNNYVYIADYAGGIRAIDISNPNTPIEAGFNIDNNGTLNANCLSIQSGYLYEGGILTNTYIGAFDIFQLETPVSSVTVNLSGSAQQTTTTDTTGYYEFANSTFGNYTVTPSINNYMVYPSQQIYTEISTDQLNQNFVLATEGVVIIDNNYKVPSFSYFSLSTCFTLSIDSSISTGNESQVVFDSWSDGGSISHNVCVDWNTTFTAYYSSNTQYYLSTQANPNTYGTVNPSEWYFSGSIATCQAYSNPGYVFENWTGNLNSRLTTDYVVMNGPASVTANFLPTSVLFTNYTISGCCFYPPSQAGYYSIPNMNPNSVVINGNYAYVAESSGLLILNISNPSSPVQVGNHPESNCVAVAVNGNYAYVLSNNTTSNLLILNISNPSNPTKVGEYDNPQSGNGLAVNGSYVCIAEGWISNGGGSSGLYIIDVSNPTSPKQVGYEPTEGSANKVVVRGNYAYVAQKGWRGNDNSYLYGGMQVCDISTPSNPIMVGSFYDTGGDALGIAVDDNYVYIARDLISLPGYWVVGPFGDSYYVPPYYSPPGLAIFDNTDPTNLTQVGSYVTGDSLGGVVVNGGYAYAIGSYVHVFNTGTPSNISEISHYNDAAQGIALNGRYLYLADYSSGNNGDLQIVNLQPPIPNTQVSLSGDTNLVTYTDDSGYYQFSNLPYGFYTVLPYQTFYEFSPTLSYSPLTVDQSEQNFYLNIFANYTSAMGAFAEAEDTVFWAFQPANGLSNQATVSWLSTYQGDSGVLQINFSSATQGVKLTSFARFTPSTTNPWYCLRVTYYCDAPCEHEQILPLILLYGSDLSETIQELGATYTGNTLIQPGEWNTIETYVYCHSSSGQIQLMAKNYGDTGAMYIDSIELDNVTPPAITSPTYVSVTVGDFATGDETTGWGFENVYNEPNGQSTISWLPTVNGQTGVLALTFTTSSQGIKMTTKDLYSIPTGANAMMSFNIAVDQSSPTALSIMGFQYAEKDVVDEEFDIGAYGNFGIMSGSTTWTTFYVPLTSFTQSTHRLQLLIRNGTQYPETIYLDDIQLFYSNEINDSFLLCKEND